ncbi:MULTISPECIES: hypothetical protein [Dyella]|uniref:Uncharacterized protein n=2 Tax=Dyella TaxID=231454 RepID=A0A4R0YZV4_9GAMM|nr:MULTISPECIES: hypothetical protein [Dyella]TBR40052.1 hypothetical protein EYV96_07700 [Dyella terrae]TCI12366.1 hypothetical protein EZM97_03170 [Dyella soli]
MSSPSLIRSLRRRLLGVRWLFALVLLTKLALGTACLAADGESVVFIPAAQVSMLAAVDDNGAGDCWHEGSGGCHCNCTHATPLASDFEMASLPPVASHRFIAPIVAATASPWRNPLRPPIA